MNKSALRFEIELSSLWVRFAASPGRLVLALLIAPALTFAPLFLFVLGKQGASYWDPRVIACFAAIALVPLVYIRLSSLLIAQLRSTSGGSGGRTGLGLRNAALVYFLLVLSSVALYLWLRP